MTCTCACRYANSQDGASLSVYNSDVSNNSAAATGGAAFVFLGNFKFVGSLGYGNKAQAEGSFIRTMGVSTVEVIRSELSENDANGPPGYYLYSDQGSGSNAYSRNGAAIFLGQTARAILNTVVMRNNANLYGLFSLFSPTFSGTAITLQGDGTKLQAVGLTLAHDCAKVRGRVRGGQPLFGTVAARALEPDSIYIFIPPLLGVDLRADCTSSQLIAPHDRQLLRLRGVRVELSNCDSDEAQVVAQGFEWLDSLWLTPKCADGTFIDQGTSAETNLCGPAAACVDAKIGGAATATIVQCVCNEPAYPDLTAGSDANVLPYSMGCVTGRDGMAAVSVSEQLVVTLKKNIATIETVRNVTVRIQGTDKAATSWHVSQSPKVAWIPEARMPLGTSGTTLPSDELQELHLPALFSAAGLPEQGDPFVTTLNVTTIGHSMTTYVSTFLVPVKFYVSAESDAHASVWGHAIGECNGSFAPAANQRVPLDAPFSIFFTSCDRDALPVQHSLPSTDDMRAFAVTASPASASATVINVLGGLHTYTLTYQRA